LVSRSAGSISREPADSLRRYHRSPHAQASDQITDGTSVEAREIRVESAPKPSQFLLPGGGFPNPTRVSPQTAK